MPQIAVATQSTARTAVGLNKTQRVRIPFGALMDVRRLSELHVITYEETWRQPHPRSPIETYGFSFRIKYVTRQARNPTPRELKNQK
jgi:hypothetical protein